VRDVATAQPASIILDSETLVNETTLVNRKSLLICVLVLLAISVASFFSYYLEGVTGDCRPDEIDGQCGMSSFYGAVYGAATSAVVLSIGGILLAIAHNRMKKIAEERDQDTNIDDNPRK
jgi:hypothetical protein